MKERDYYFNQEKKERIRRTLLDEKKLSELPFEIDHVSQGTF